MKTSPINIVFKQIFKVFVHEFFDCEGFVESIDKCKSYDDLNSLLEDNAYRIASCLDSSLIDPDDYECDNCSDLETSIVNLEEELDKLENVNLDLDTLVDEMKFECFVENHNKFSLKEFQQLMQ